jgi:hypothetical protein
LFLSKRIQLCINATNASSLGTILAAAIYQFNVEINAAGITTIQHVKLTGTSHIAATVEVTMLLASTVAPTTKPQLLPKK